jgi:hypothetical protein
MSKATRYDRAHIFELPGLQKPAHAAIFHATRADLW